MIRQAQRDFDLSLPDSVMVGDKESDMLAGKNAGIGKCMLVRSGHPVEEEGTAADEVLESIADIKI